MSRQRRRKTDIQKYGPLGAIAAIIFLAVIGIIVVGATEYRQRTELAKGTPTPTLQQFNDRLEFKNAQLEKRLAETPTPTPAPPQEWEVRGNELRIAAPIGANIWIIGATSPVVLKNSNCRGGEPQLTNSTTFRGTTLLYSSTYYLSPQVGGCKLRLESLTGEISFEKMEVFFGDPPIELRTAATPSTTATPPAATPQVAKPNTSCTPVPGAQRAVSPQDMEEKVLQAVQAELFCR